MCGIHFVINGATLGAKTDDYFKDAFIANQLRGMHSSGMFVMNKKDEITYHKAAECGQEFIKDARVRNLIATIPNSRLAVGHVRHATSGAISDENAHPFIVQREDGTEIVGVHNGSLRLWQQKGDGTKLKVDSEWAFTKIAELGVDAFRYFDGAYAFVWVDTAQPDVVNMIRNKERPLHYMISKDGNSIVGCSELGMLGWLSERNNIERGDKFYYLPEDKLFKFSLKNIGRVTEHAVPKYDATTTKYPPVAQYNRNAYDPYNMYNYRHEGQDEWDDQLPFGNGGTSLHPSRSYTPVQYPSQTKLYLDRIRTILTPPAVSQKPNDDSKSESASSESESKTSDGNNAVDFEKQIKDELMDYRRRKNKEPSMAGAFIPNPNDKGATKAQIAAAQGLGRYGEVVLFSGVLYDDETGEGMGSITYQKADGKTDSCDAVMIGLSSGVFTHRYINSVNAKLAVIVGWDPNTGSGFQPYYLLAELTAAQRELLNKRIHTAVN